MRAAGVPVLVGGEVDLSTDKTIDAGADRRGYRFVGVLHADGVVRAIAGCHCFTLREARRWWAREHRGMARPTPRK